ncbi:MAG: BMP family ABC transporter substrate-binding protein [Acidimicrobiia bacterium]|nr:BMP family ABC transporter substrate-binding protein [Acidimicrobiia bacterium]MDX2467748.1 BMP family ABC transporter substrate-binding protein [Acidimicrobiia bacterium]
MQRRSRGWVFAAMLMAFALIAGSCGGSDEVEGEGFTFGLILVGPSNDRGWSQAHYEAGQYVEEQTGATMIFLDKVNVADLPDKGVDQVAQDMIDQGAQMIFATSDDMKDGILLAAETNPDIPMVWASGDSAWEEGEAFVGLENLGNVMTRLEFGKMIAGCSAALTTQTGSIGYLGPLINAETRRFVNSAYLGAQYCWEEYRGETTPLNFEVVWIGFWFNIPGVTLDPTQVANGFFDGGADVVISGTDTTEGLVVAGQRAAAGEQVWNVAYDFEGACEEAPDVCLGVPYFNWVPSYMQLVSDAIEGDFEATFDWVEPNWDDLNDKTDGGVGWVTGPGMSEDNAEQLDEFIAGLAGGDIELFVGPLNYQDGSEYLADGEKVTDNKLWYTKQLLEGIAGASNP